MSQDQTLISAVPIEGNGVRESHRGDGYGQPGDPSFTLNGTEHHAVAFGISPYASNAMLSDNPNSGIYEADTSRTLDNNGGSPACNQGGVAVVQKPCAMAVDAWNGTEAEECNGNLQSSASHNIHSNNVVRVSSS